MSRIPNKSTRYIPWNLYKRSEDKWPEWGRWKQAQGESQPTDHAPTTLNRQFNSTGPGSSPTTEDSAPGPPLNLPTASRGNAPERTKSQQAQKHTSGTSNLQNFHGSQAGPSTQRSPSATQNQRLRTNAEVLKTEPDAALEEAVRLRAEIAERDQAITKKDDAIAQRDRVITEKNDAITEKDEAITEKDDAIAQRDRVITEKNEAIAEKDDAIAQRDRVITEKNDAITKKDEAITKKDDAIAQRDRVITEKNEAIAEKDDAIAEKNEAIAKARGRIKKLKNEIKSLQTIAAGLQETLLSQSAKNDETRLDTRSGSFKPSGLARKNGELSRAMRDEQNRVYTKPGPPNSSFTTMT